MASHQPTWPMCSTGVCVPGRLFWDLVRQGLRLARRPSLPRWDPVEQCLRYALRSRCLVLPPLLRRQKGVAVLVRAVHELTPSQVETIAARRRGDAEWKAHERENGSNEGWESPPRAVERGERPLQLQLQLQLQPQPLPRSDW